MSIIIGAAEKDHPTQCVAVALSCLGVIGLGIVEATENEALEEPDKSI